MKRERRPLPDVLQLGTRLQRWCSCGRKLGRYQVTRIGGGRKEAWADRIDRPKNQKAMWPLIVRADDFADWREHFTVLP